ncbi:hypothetical protein Bca4012_089881 [Brassica carinata]
MEIGDVATNLLEESCPQNLSCQTQIHKHRMVKETTDYISVFRCFMFGELIDMNGGI